MKVTISHLDAMRFEAKTDRGQRFVIDCPVISPIEYFLAGLIACTTSDLIAIPNKQGKTVGNLSVEGDATRNETPPCKFNALHIDYRFDSDADDTTALRWVQGSIETYCSTINTVRDTTKITYTVTHNGNVLRENEAIISGQGSDIDFGEIDACCSE